LYFQDFFCLNLVFPFFSILINLSPTFFRSFPLAFFLYLATWHNKPGARFFLVFLPMASKLAAPWANPKKVTENQPETSKKTRRKDEKTKKITRDEKKKPQTPPDRTNNSQ